MSNEVKAKLDEILGFFISKKLTVFIISTIALFTQFVQSTEWVVLACIYIAAQGTTDVIAIMRAGNNSSSGSYYGEHYGSYKKTNKSEDIE